MDTKDPFYRILCGDYSNLPAEETNVVRIFLSSTFGDFIHERNKLMREAFPELRNYCQQHGLEFEVADMRWGVRDEAISYHLTSDICIQEIANCTRISLGPSFLAFIGNRYGYRPFPAKISVEEFEIFLRAASANHLSATLLETWFRRDDNANPPVFQLLPITKHFPNYISKDPDLQKKDRDGWWSTFSQIQRLFWQLAESAVKSEMMTSEQAHKFMMSVTEDETAEGMFKLPDPNSYCLCYMREMEGIHSHLSDRMAHRYTDLSSVDPPVVDITAQKLLHNLKHKTIPKYLSSSNIRGYSVPWIDGGISPTNATHASYLDRFSRHVFEDIKHLIDRALAARASSSMVQKQLHAEVLHHASFCTIKCESFHGREDVLAKIGSYLTSKHTRPLVVYGKSGAGKTTVMAKITASARNWLGDSCAIVVRFFGTSPRSSNIREALTSICLQICAVYHLPPPKFDQMDATEIVQFFRSQILESLTLSLQSSLLIVLDSIDQLSPEDGAHTMSWLPKQLPSNVHIVVSVLPDRHNCLSIMQSRLPYPECYVKVDVMPVSTGIAILDAWLSKAGRVITPVQKEVVSKAFAACPQPLFMKLVFGQALQWKSYIPPESITLPNSVQATLTQLFSQLEEQHGKILVQHALGHLTAARNGLTEAELEDVLSLDDQVLDDVYQYWDPPHENIVRIPQLLWKRIRHDIADYLVQQQADGKTVLVWYHRQFIESARNRYLGEMEQTQTSHSLLALYFEGTWSGGKPKPVILSHRQLTIENADRKVASQPIKFSEEVYNFRKLSELPFHLSRSGQLKKLKQLCLCSFEWLLEKLSAMSYISLMQDFTLALSCFTDQDLALVSETLSLAASNLQANPASLAGQLLGRLMGIQGQTDSRHISHLLQQGGEWAHGSKDCQLIPRKSCLTSPGGPLKTTLSGHPRLIQKLCISSKEHLAMSSSKGEGSALFNVWDISTLECVQNVQSFKIPGSTTPQLAVLHSLVVGSCDNTVQIWSAETGENLHTLKADTNITSLSMSSDAQYIVTGTECGQIAIWGLNKQFGGASHVLPLHEAAVTSLVLTSDNQVIVSGSQDGKVYTSKLFPSPECTHSIVAHSKSVTCISTVAHESHLYGVTGSEDKSIKVIDLHQGEVLHTLMGHSKTIKCIQISKPDCYTGKPVVISGSLDKLLKVWDILSGTCIHSLSGHTDGVWCVAVLQGSQNLVVSGSKDDYLKVWDLGSGKCLHTLEGHSSWISCVATLGEDIVLSGSNDKTVKVWKLEESKFAHPERHFTQPECIATTDAGLVISGAPKDVKVWRATDGKCLHTWSTSASALVTNGHHLLISGAKDGTITAWNLTTFEKRQVLSGHTSGVTCLKLVQNASTLVSGSADGSLKIWDLNTWSCKGSLSSHSDGIKCLATSPDSFIIASGSHDASIRVWDLQSQKCLAPLLGHTKVVWCIAINHSSGTLASGSDDRSLRIWDLNQFHCLHTIHYPDNVKCVAITIDGSTVIAGAHCSEQQLKAWSVISGKCLRLYEGHTHAVMCMLFSPNNKYLITGSRDGTIKVWHLLSAKLLASFDLQSQVKHLSLTNITENCATLATITKSVPIAIFDVKHSGH